MSMLVLCTHAVLGSFFQHESPGRAFIILLSAENDTYSLTVDCRLKLHALISSDGCEPHASALLTSLPQFISPPTSV